MSKDIVPQFEAIQSTIEVAKEQEQLTGPSRAKALERELEQLDQINESMDALIQSIETTSTNMDVVLSTTVSTNTLLGLWIKILSQTSYTSNLLSDRNWKGLTKNEEEYHEQLKKFEELSRRYNAEKQKKEQEKDATRLKRQAQEQRLREREEALRRRVYGTRSTPARASSRPSTPDAGSSVGK